MRGATTLSAGLAILWFAGCGGSNSAADHTETSDASVTATARAFVVAQLGPGASMGTCNVAAQTPFEIGPTPSPGQTVTRVDDGADGGLVAVACKVKSSDAGFSVMLEAADNSTTNGGELRLSGLVSSNGDATNIAVALDTLGVQYSGSDCTVVPTFTLTPGNAPGAPSVAAGRIFGHAECLNATTASSGGMPSFCLLEADFVFENCSE
jgi:hypothetical protein